METHFLIEEVTDASHEDLYLVIDRGVYKNDDEYIKRVIDSIENGFNQGMIQSILKP